MAGFFKRAAEGFKEDDNGDHHRLESERISFAGEGDTEEADLKAQHMPRRKNRQKIDIELSESLEFDAPKMLSTQ